MHRPVVAGRLALALGACVALLAVPAGSFVAPAPPRAWRAGGARADSCLAPIRADAGSSLLCARGLARASSAMMAKNKLKNAMAGAQSALDLLEQQANEVAAAAGIAPPEPPPPPALKGKKLKASKSAALECAAPALNEASPMDELLKAKALLDAGAAGAARMATAQAAQVAADAEATMNMAAVATAASKAAEAKAAMAKGAAAAQAPLVEVDVLPPAADFTEARARRQPRIAQWADAPDGTINNKARELPVLVSLPAVPCPLLAVFLFLPGPTVTCWHVTLRFQDRLLLDKASWEVKTGERVGLVGPNGCGKSTQLRLLTEELLPDGGGIVKSSAKLEVAMLRQEFLEQSKSVI
ncbi:hypothetical protein T492DRAFT_848639 [Pavlovales sp. CCMP2436]|nr:hypothetical protein T492DRAFT_848639 [Pavlovales sp. CCMP2436]